MKTALKMLSEDRVGGYLVVFGSAREKDLQGEYFTPETEFHLDWFDRRPAMYHHGLDGKLKTEPIGVIDRLESDDVGLWAEAQLDMRNEYVEAVRKLIERGALAWSSGSIPHMVKIAGDGKIEEWPIVEGSATPTPAEPRHTDIGFIKSVYADLGITWPALASVEPEAKEMSAPMPATSEAKQVDQQSEDSMNEIINAVLQAVAAQGVELSEDQINAIVQQVQDALNAPPADATASVEVKSEDLATLVNDAVAAAMKASNRPVSRAGNVNAQRQPRIEVRSKYADLSVEDLSFFHMMRQQVRRVKGLPWAAPDDKFRAEIMDRTVKAWQSGEIRLDADTIKSIKADELMYSTQANYGDEWVPELWASQLWEKARLENQILPLFETVEMPSNPHRLPGDGADPTVYYVAETKDKASLTLTGAPIAMSKPGTSAKVLTAQKLGLQLAYSAELDEDSIIPIAGQERRRAIRVLEDAIDHALLNGDTEPGATGNINLVDSTPPATSKYLVFNGLRKLPLVTNTGNSVDASNVAPTLALIRQTRATMSAAYATRPQDLALIVDPWTHYKLLGMTEFITLDKAGPAATNLNGMIGMIDGYPVIVSAEFGLANTAGKISNTGGNNVRGSALLVYRPGWRVGFRRRVNATVEFKPEYDAFILTATARVAFINFDTEVSAILYNIAV